MNAIQSLDRRRFLIATAVYGGGMTLGLVLPDGDVEAASIGAQPWTQDSSAGANELNPWITIAPDDTVTIRVTTPDNGNGVMTQAGMTVTEELQCDWSKVRVEFASTSRDYCENAVYSVAGGNVAWFSGRSTNSERMKLALQVGASARERLKAAAATQWKVAVTEIDATNSVLTHLPTGRTLRYGEMAAKAAAIHLDREPALKPQSAWTFLGKASPAKLQIPAIVNGSAIYGMDVRVPGMVYAALRQSPVHGGKVKRIDADAVKAMPGVLAVVTVDPDEPRGITEKNLAPFGLDRAGAQSAVAVIAVHYWQARRALDALPVEWDDGKGAEWKTTQQVYRAAIDAVERPGAKVEKTKGDPGGIDRQKNLVEALYTTPYCDQAPLEPLNGTALVTPDRVEVWHPAQVSKQALWVAADETGVSPANITFNQTYVGGAFGRRVYGDDVRMVVAVAKKFPGRPVHVIWSREEATRQGRYRPMVAVKLKAGIDANGAPHAILARVSAGHGMGLTGLIDSPYISEGGIPNVQIESTDLPLHILTGAYRGPGYNSHAFILETFIDECAVAAKIDPVEYRLRLLANWPDPAWANCLKVAAEKSGWGKSLPAGTGRGVAISNWSGKGKVRAGTTVCAVATVEVSRTGEIKVQQIDLTFDVGRIVNRDAVLAQLEGGVVYGLNMALNEELNIKDGRIVEGNFDAYPMLRTGNIPPKINIHFDALSGDDRFSEVGEPPVGVVGPAVGNAIFQATGKRIRTQPFRTVDLNWA